MIQNLSYRLAVFVNTVARHVAPGGKTLADAVVQVAFEHQKAHPDEVLYVGSGYWRLRLVPSPSGDYLEGVRVVNPTCTAEEIAVVERAVAILMHVPYKSNGGSAV
jgi:hypothetical protein